MSADGSGARVLVPPPERPRGLIGALGAPFCQARRWSTGSRFGTGSLRIFLLLRTLVVAVGLWWLAASLWVKDPYQLPPPDRVYDAWAALLTSGRLWSETQISLQRLAIGYGLAAVAGTIAGLAMGRWKRVGEMADPLVNIGRSISGIAWIPILLLLFGVGETLAVAVIFYGAVFPFVLNVQKGMGSIDERHLHAARSLGAGRIRTTVEVLLPALLPYVFTGARVGLGVAWMSIIAAELLGAPSGLGFSILYSLQISLPSQMLAWVLWVGVIGFLLDRLLRVVFARSAPWVFAKRVGAE